mgnify:CR=1 FL=1
MKNKIEELLKKMTVKEKVGQLNQCGNSIYNDDYKVGWDLLREGMIGSFLGISNVEDANELQRVAVEETRLGIPLLLGFDVIHGFRTCFPTPWSESFSWEPQLAHETSEYSSAEASANGVNWIYAPMIDVSRDPRWGRGVEGAGEDPYLISEFAKARVKGIQGEKMSDGRHSAACAKHFAAYGACEGGRDYNSVTMMPQTLHDYYLPPFKAAIDAGAESVMTAFHDLNGEPCTGSHELITETLKQKMGFKGVVISDAGSTDQIKTHGCAETYRDVAKIAVNAGLDVEMCFGIFTYQDHLEDLVNSGEVSMEVLDEAVRRVLTLKYKLGLFDNPYRDIEEAKKALCTAEGRKLAYKSAVKSVVLLKNCGNILPLSEKSKIAVAGPMADSREEMLGSWSALGKAEECVAPIEGIKKYVDVPFTGGCSLIGSESNFDEVTQAASDADTVVAFIGEPRDMNGEGKSRTSNTIPGEQINLLRHIKSLGKKLVSVVIAGRPVVLSEVVELSDAVLFSGALGNEAGNAYADILFGKQNPSGKLVNTFPTKVGQAPLYYNHNNTGKPPVEEFFWTSKYIDAPIKPLFPFGYGLSYTEFEYSDMELSSYKAECGSVITVSVNVKNTGEYDGEETVQFYVTDKVASYTRPVKELKGFKKVFLKKGEQKRVSVELNTAEMGFHNRKLEYIVEPGEFIVSAGRNSEDVLQKEMCLL